MLTDDELRHLLVIVRAYDEFAALISEHLEFAATIEQVHAAGVRMRYATDAALRAATAGLDEHGRAIALDPRPIPAEDDYSQHEA